MGKALTMAWMLLVLVACADTNSPITSERSLDTAADSTQISTIDRYFSIYAYGSTLRLYYFTDQNAILMLRFPNDNTDFKLTGTLNIFSESETEASIAEWINNQHSDALIADAPDPVLVVPVENYSIVSSSLIDSETAGDGYIYDNYRIEFFIDTMSSSGEYHLASFSDEVIVHVRTVLAAQPQPPAAPEPPSTAEPPVTTDPPTTTEPPVSTEPPPSTEPPVTIDPPITTEPPVTTDPPPTTEPPVTTDPPPTTEPPVTTDPPPTSEPPVTTDPPVTTEPPVSTEQLLDVFGADTMVTTISSYFSRFRYGDTLRFYHFTAQNAVLKIRLPNSDTSFALESSLVIFSPSQTPESINKWINNQYSDALFVDAPQPELEEIIDATHYSIMSSTYIDSEQVTAGESYDNYQVDFFMDGNITAGDYRLLAFSDTAIVHVVNNNILPPPAEKILDVTSDDIKITTISGFFGLLGAGITTRIFHFQSQNIVLRVRFPKVNSSIAIEGEFFVFDDSETAYNVSLFVNNLYSDVVYPNAPRPLATIPVQSSQYTIITSDYVDSTPDGFGNQYDNYNVEYAFSDTVESGVFHLLPFADAVTVHIYVSAP